MCAHRVVRMKPKLLVLCVPQVRFNKRHTTLDTMQELDRKRDREIYIYTIFREEGSECELLNKPFPVYASDRVVVRITDDTHFFPLDIPADHDFITNRLQYISSAALSVGEKFIHLECFFCSLN